MKNQINNTAAKQEAIKFLLSFTKDDFKDDTKTYDKFKAYRSLHKAGKLGAKSYDTILKYLGYEKTEIWHKTKPSDKLIDILTD